MKKRAHEIHVLLTEEEMNRIRQRMNEAGVRNQSAFIRKMILDGYIVKLDMDDIDKMVSLLRSSSNNLNQIAKKANATNTIYGADIAEMRMKQDEIWELAKEILARLSTIQ